MSADFRREWIKNKVVKCFGLSSGDYFEEMMANNDDLDDKLAALLDDDFLNQDECDNRIFYCYRSSFEKLIEEEIMVPEIVEELETEEPEIPVDIPKKGKKDKKGKKGGRKGGKKRKTPAPSEEGDAPPEEGGEAAESSPDESSPVASSPEDGGAAESDVPPEEPSPRAEGDVSPESAATEPITGSGDVTDAESPAESPTEDEAGAKKKGKGKKGKKGKEKGKKKKKKKMEEEPIEVPKEPEIRYVPKMVQKVVIDYELHGNFGFIDAEAAKQVRFVYFLRKTEESIPWFENSEDAEAEMSDYFFIGSCTNNLLESIESVCRQVKHRQFRILPSELLYF